MILYGRCISPGAFEGTALVLDSNTWIESAAAGATRRTPEAEVERLRSAEARAASQLDQMGQQLVRHGHHADAEIFTVHAIMIRDPIFLQRIESAIRGEGDSAETAIAEATAEMHAEFDSSPIEMVRDKAPDILDIGRRLLRCLGAGEEGRATPLDHPVLVAATLTPSDLVRFAQLGPCGALTETCGEKSHTAILARSLGVPLLTGLGRVVGQVKPAARVLMDADAGIALIDPAKEERTEETRIRFALARIEQEPFRARQPSTQDGVPIHLSLNISGARDAEFVSQLGAAGVGLFRTEFLYMARDSWPTEADCLADYEETAAATGAGELYIRLADFGADKSPDYAIFPSSRNPSLGVRGVRLLLDREDILGPQVRALAALSARRPVVMLVPMLDSVDTLHELLSQLERLCGLERSAFPFRIGAMVEVPAAALCIDRILEETDLAAIGLNDLTQYLLAADREDESVQRFHDALQPAVLQLIRRVVVAGAARGKPVSVCGELAGDPALTSALLALGVHRFSVSRPDYARVADRIEGLSLSALAGCREALLEAPTSRAVRKVLHEFRG